jgi:hypothetical protein
LYTKEKGWHYPWNNRGLQRVLGIFPSPKEAALTCELMVKRCSAIYDVGVSGLHRLIHRLDDVQQSNVIIVCRRYGRRSWASVVGGLVQILSGHWRFPTI